MSDAASAALSCSASALFTFAKHVVAFPILGCAGSLGALSAVDASGSLYVLCPIVTLCCGGIGAVHGACNAVHVIVVESGLVPRIAKELIPQLESERGVEVGTTQGNTWLIEQQQQPPSPMMMAGGSRASSGGVYIDVELGKHGVDRVAMLAAIKAKRLDRLTKLEDVYLSRGICIPGMEEVDHALRGVFQPFP